MSFQVALSGLNAASTDLQVTSNNIANANTTGFKSSRAEFSDVFSGDSSGIGNGVRLTDVRQEFTQGNVEITSRELDLAISGNGFFIVNDGGSLLYSRVGAFGMDADGNVENAQGERLQIYPPNGDDTFNTGTLADLRITTDTSPPQSSTNVDMNINLPADAAMPAVGTFDPNDPATYNHSTSTVLFDSLGIAHTGTYYFAKTAGGGWEVNQTVDGNVVGTAQPFDFNSDGSIANPPNGVVTYPAYDPGNGSDPMNMEVDLSATTQYGSNFVVNSLNPDGRAAGRLRNIGIEQDGVIFARFSNGQSLALGKIALANFSNPEGLNKSSDTSFSETFASGVPQRGEATESNFGLIQSGSLESSNVDLTEQLVNMITAQRLFQANAQVISTMDTVTQTIINIR
ncbi:MAG: flagellar hook protein FlgE [Gammaproteobacteria bacterium]|nr:flagellar hook protein FlgE [Gammaproteobacteria bacterium]